MLLPTPVLRRIYEPFLRRIPADEAWASSLRAAARRGAIVHVVRNVSLLDLLALQHLSERFDLPEIGFANHFAELLPGAPRRSVLGGPEDPADALRRAIRAGKSAVLFLKRAPGVLERAGILERLRSKGNTPRPAATHRGKTEGDALLSALLDIAVEGAESFDSRRSGAPRDVLLVPETLVWTLRPARLGFSVNDFLFSPAEFPGEVRALLQLTTNHEHVVVRAGEPVSLRELCATDDAADPNLIRRLVYALLRKVERERKSVVGPVQKPPDRVREEVLKSPRLASVLRDAGGADEAKHHAAVERARDMLRELQAEPDPSTLRALEALADTIAERVFAGIDVDEEGIERLREAARRGSVILLPSHKSHVDYLLLHYVLRKHALSLPLVAAGDNLSFFPLGSLLRRSGAFFIRRNFRGDKLYAIVVDAYVRRLLRDGYAIEFFLEGGRSRTGKLLPPQVGLLNMVVDAALGIDNREISFVPVSIGYERMMEETEFLRELSGEAKRGEDLSSLVSAASALLGSYGRPNVQIGRVFDLSDLRRQMAIPSEPSPAKRRALVSALSQLVMDEINRVTAVTPGALVATVLLCHPRRGMPHAELLTRARRLLALVRSMGARTTPKLTEGPTGDLSEAAIREAAEVYVRGGLLRRHVPGDTLTGLRRARSAATEDPIWIVPEERRIALDIPKNMIVHLFTPRAIVAISLGAQRHSRGPASPESGPPSGASGWDTQSVISRARFLSKLLRIELSLRVDATFEPRFTETLAAMIDSGEVARSETGILVPGPGHDGLDGRGWLLFHASVLRNFLEGYRVAARALRTLIPPMNDGAPVPPVDPREMVLRALRIGEQMFLGGEIERAEAVSRSLIDNALHTFRDLGYLARDPDKVLLSPAHATEESASAVESQIADYLAAPIYGSDY